MMSHAARLKIDPENHVVMHCHPANLLAMNVYHVPLIPILVMILLVGILQIVLSCVLSSNLKKETLVERIRYQG